MHWTAGFRRVSTSSVAGPPPVMCSVRRLPRVMIINALSEEAYYTHLDRPHNPPDPAMPTDAFDAEYYRLFDRVVAIMSEHGENNAYGEGDYCLEPHIVQSRGLGFEITNPSIVTEHLILRLQALVAQHAAAWELYLGSCQCDFGIFIGPTTISMHRHHNSLPHLNEFVANVA